MATFTVVARPLGRIRIPSTLERRVLPGIVPTEVGMIFSRERYWRVWIVTIVEQPILSAEMSPSTILAPPFLLRVSLFLTMVEAEKHRV
jgi:hypothetical protein